MENIKLVKSKKGWLLTIGERSDILAITSLELWTLGKMIMDNSKKIMEELENEET